MTLDIPRMEVIACSMYCTDMSPARIERWLAVYEPSNQVADLLEVADATLALGGAMELGNSLSDRVLICQNLSAIDSAELLCRVVERLLDDVHLMVRFMVLHRAPWNNESCELLKRLRPKIQSLLSSEHEIERTKAFAALVRLCPLELGDLPELTAIESRAPPEDRRTLAQLYRARADARSRERLHSFLDDDDGTVSFQALSALRAIEPDFNPLPVMLRLAKRADGQRAYSLIEEAKESGAAALADVASELAKSSDPEVLMAVAHYLYLYIEIDPSLAQSSGAALLAVIPAVTAEGRLVSWLNKLPPEQFYQAACISLAALPADNDQRLNDWAFGVGRSNATEKIELLIEKDLPQSQFASRRPMLAHHLLAHEEGGRSPRHRLDLAAKVLHGQPGLTLESNLFGLAILFHRTKAEDAAAELRTIQNTSESESKRRYAEKILGGTHPMDAGGFK